MWVYARDSYNLDLTTELGYTQLCYWHNTGAPPTKIKSWGYADTVRKYRAEIQIVSREE
jgi:hypothetical protein